MIEIFFYVSRKGGDIISKKPKSDAKINQVRLLFSNDELEKLDFICEVENLSRAAVIRKWIDEKYPKAKKKG
ncbi:MAG: hypothetical protein FWC97_02705 [Treponema sp.]|nr:hypothetical protein [Treponema sp.]